jgi:hypothetical protein
MREWNTGSDYIPYPVSRIPYPVSCIFKMIWKFGIKVVLLQPFYNIQYSH